MKYTFLNLAEDVLEYFKEPLSIDNIWKGAEKLGILNKLGSNGKTPKKSLSARLYSDIKNDNSIFYKEGREPVKFGLKIYKNNVNRNFDNIVHTEKTKKFKERDLHILLSTFVKNDSNFKCFTKTIMHEKSSRATKGKNKWLHPDMVGVYYPFDDYSKSVLELLKIFESPYRLFSFEIKISLDFKNLREYYFQAVSNSSWANEGYLVALEIDEEIYEELKRLNNSFGIGVIKLDPKNIYQSDIIFLAREHKNLDWDTIDRIALENKDFNSFITNLLSEKTIYKTNEIYDKTFDTEEETESYSLKKGIL